MVDMKAATRFANELKKLTISSCQQLRPRCDCFPGQPAACDPGREISGQPSFIAAVQPTRGLDVGAIEGVQRLAPGPA